MCNVCFMIIIIFRNKMKADKITCEDFFRKEKLMELMQGLLTRRSVHQYTDQAVPVSDIRDIVTAGMYAPSARHQLIWKFVVVTDREKLERLGTELKTAPMAKTAAFAVAVCADLNGAASPDYWVQDCAAATQNILLACHAKGLGAVWIGMYPHAEREDIVKSVCGIPADIKVQSLIVAGHPAAPAKEEDRFDERKIRFNDWND